MRPLPCVLARFVLALALASALVAQAPPEAAPQSAAGNQAVPPASVPAGMREYREGDYETAIPLLQKTAAAAAADAQVHAALLAALTYQGRVEEASNAADEAVTRFPKSAPVLAARGDFAFYMGDLATSEKLYLEALRLDSKCARAVYGISRLRHAMSLSRTARLLVLQAHELDPDDALITSVWMRYLVGEKRRELLPPFMASHPWFYQHAGEQERTGTALTTELNGQKMFSSDTPPAETTLKLIPVRPNGRILRAVAIELQIEDRKPLTLLLDTGASGILVNQRAVDKAGLDHLGSGRSWGIGDAGVNKTFYAIAQTCAIGSLHFHNCLLNSQAGKRAIVPDTDGLIGADVFAQYLMEINFQKYTLHLQPLPALPPSPQGYDRVIPPNEADFTPIFRFGHELCVLTRVNQGAWGLFMLDTGASSSLIDTTFAKLSTKVEREDMVRLRGVSGEVKDVFVTGHAELQFARFKQDNVALLATNLNTYPEHQETRLSGLIGFPVLYLFRLQLDYRNGLVKFDYIFEKNAEHKK